MPPPPSEVELEARWRELAGQVEDALLHYEIGIRTAGERLPVDWEHVAGQMAACLAEWVEVDGVDVMVLPGGPEWPQRPWEVG